MISYFSIVVREHTLHKFHTFIFIEDNLCILQNAPCALQKVSICCYWVECSVTVLSLTGSHVQVFYFLIMYYLVSVLIVDISNYDCQILYFFFHFCQVLLFAFRHPIVRCRYVYNCHIFFIMCYHSELINELYCIMYYLYHVLSLSSFIFSNICSILSDTSITIAFFLLLFAEYIFFVLQLSTCLCLWFSSPKCVYIQTP